MIVVTKDPRKAQRGRWGSTPLAVPVWAPGFADLSFFYIILYMQVAMHIYIFTGFPCLLSAYCLSMT